MHDCKGRCHIIHSYSCHTRQDADDDPILLPISDDNSVDSSLYSQDSESEGGFWDNQYNVVVSIAPEGAWANSIRWWRLKSATGRFASWKQHWFWTRGSKFCPQYCSGSNTSSWGSYYRQWCEKDKQYPPCRVAMWCWWQTRENHDEYCFERK